MADYTSNGTTFAAKNFICNDYNWHTCSILFSITLDQFTKVTLLWWISLKFSGYSILQKQIVSIMHVFIKQF